MVMDPSPAPLRQAVVLCVDDDAGILASLRRLLRSEPYEVVTAPSAAQALACLRTRPVDVVISDERMPGTGGCELLAEVRQRWPWIGRVILTGYLGLPVTICGFQTGIDSLIAKPWDDEALKKILRRLLFGSQRDENPNGPIFHPGGEAGGSVEQRSPRKLVVLIDDEPEILAALKRSLAREPYLVVTTTQPRSALRWVEVLGVSAVVSDERMPGMSGTDFLARVSDRSPATGRIMLTAFAGAAARRPGFQESVQCMIAKPWDDSMLRLTLREFLSDRATAEADDAGLDPGSSHE
jgi:DNA-binding NtrC family response regulator